MQFNDTEKPCDCPGNSTGINPQTWNDVRVAINHDSTCDLDEVRRAIPILLAPGEPHELRALPSGRGQVIVADSLDAACEAVQAVCNQTVYYSLNPIQRNASRASTKTVLVRQWFLVDIDPVRPTDVSATDAEKDAASEVMATLLGYLANLGWPMPVLIDSGNGFHLLYRINLPADKLVQQILKGCLEFLATRFDTSTAKIDRAVHDAPRIAKLPGTWSRKGIPTPERPYRLCRLIAIPKDLEIVPIEKFKTIGQHVEKNARSSHDNGNVSLAWSDVTVKGGRGLESFVRSAIEREGYRILSATQGTRNVALNRAAFSLGTMAGWPEMHAEETKAHLIRDGERAGLTPHECFLTVESGWSAGEKEQRIRPVDPQRNGKHENNGDVPDKLVIFGDKVNPKKIAWIWNLRIAAGFISIFAGKTGIGKSFILCEITARLTTGRILPEETTAAPLCNVLFISEDPIEYVLVPRLMELKADLTRVAFMTWEAMDAYTLGDKDTLQRAYEQAGCPKLVIFDPPGNFLGGKDEHKNAEVRSVVMKLVSWLDEHQVAAVFVTHINRRLEKGVEALDRIMGSVAWGTTARIALGFADDPNTTGQCVCAGIKNNLGPKAPTLGYEIKKTDLLAIIEWKGIQEVNADEAFNKVKRVPRAARAADWLIVRFREKSSWPSDDLYDIGRGEGVSRSAIWEAASALPLIRQNVSPQDGGKRFWQWTAKPGWPPIEEGKIQEPVADGKSF